MNNDAPGSDSGVSVFVDDIPTTGVADNNLDLFDLASVEVLRGPQGTLFGRNVTGGAVTVHTLQPSFETQYKAQATYGSFNLGEVRAYLTGPLIKDKLAGKITFEGRRQDGILNNVFLNRKVLSTELFSVRGQLLWTPTSELRVLFGADYTDDTSPYKVQQLVGNFQPSILGHLGYGPNDNNQGVDSRGRARTGGGLVRIDYQAPWGTATSISGVRVVDQRAFFSTSAEPLNEILQRPTNRALQVTQELRFASPVDRKFTWVGGFFFLDSLRQQYKHYDLNVAPGTLVSFVDPYSALAYTADQDQTVVTHSYAAFGEANYAFTPQLKLTLGARYTTEDKSGHNSVTDTSGLSPVLVLPYFSHTWDAFTPKATLSWEPNTRFLAYATFAEGFKSGGYDLSGTTIAGLATPFRPERVKSYEAGVKISALHKRLILNVAGYYADYTDLQVQEYNQALLQVVTSNAGRSKIPGVEVEATANLVKWLTLNANYTYMDANYSRYDSGQGNFSGNQIPFDAKSHLNLGGDVHFTVAALSGSLVQAGGDVTFQSSRQFDDANTTPAFILDRTPIHGLINFHVDVTSPNEAWNVSFWGKNITDRRYITFATDLTAFYATPDEYFSPAGNKVFDNDWNTRAMFGVSLTYKH